MEAALRLAIVANVATATAVQAGAGTASSSGRCINNGSYEVHWGRIGPKSEQAKRDELTCSTAAACPTEAAAACNAQHNCSSFGISENWRDGSAAELYATKWDKSIADSMWRLYTCVGDGPPPGPAPPPPFPRAPPLAPVGHCKTDIDCSLNGKCDPQSGACACNAPWKHGPSGREACNVLDVLPHPDDYVPAYGSDAHKRTAFGPQNTSHTITSWGGNIIVDDSVTPPVYHLWVSAMGVGHGLSGWGAISQIDHATATDPMHAFTKRDVALPKEAHNASPLRAKNGSYLLFHIGDAGDKAPARSGFLHHAESPTGPWLPVAGPSCNNPAPMFHNNGTAYVGCNSGGFNIYRSADVFHGEWVHVTKLEFPESWQNGTHAEDPYLFMDTAGHWHLLAHRWDYRDGWPINPQQTMPVLVSGHAFSYDGISWHFNVVEQPYNATVKFENGTMQQFSTFERPHLLFNSVGQPTHLINGVSPYWDPPSAEGPCDGCDARPGSNHSCVVCKTSHGIDWTFTLVSKLNV